MLIAHDVGGYQVSDDEVDMIERVEYDNRLARHAAARLPNTAPHPDTRTYFDRTIMAPVAPGAAGRPRSAPRRSTRRRGPVGFGLLDPLAHHQAPPRLRGLVGRGLLAGAVAGVVSGAPSTVNAWWRGDDVTAASRAAGTLLGRPSLPRAATAHLVLSLGWGVVIAGALPRRARPSAGALAGAMAGALIAEVDLVLVGRRFPAIAALSLGPQIADHLVYGTVAGLVLARLGMEGPARPPCHPRRQTT